MGKMGEELEKRLDENKYALLNVLKGVRKSTKFFYLPAFLREMVSDVLAKIEGVGST